jgi:hypothetical protein
MMRPVLVWVLMLLGGAVVISTPLVQAEIMGDYVSFTACIGCHDDHVEGWKTTPHAHAFENLKKQGAEKQQNPGCVKCHVVSFEAEGGFIDMDLTPELKDVQCESCHGPGRKHVESQDPADITGQPDEAGCRVCHTEGQDKNFNFAIKYKNIHGEPRKGK